MFLLNAIQQPLPPYNPRTGKSLWVQRPDNFGRPLITTEDDDDTPSISKRLGISNDPFDKVKLVVSSRIPDPTKIDLKSILEKLKLLKKKK